MRSLLNACSARTNRWTLQDAKAKFSEVVQRAVDGQPQCVSRHGKDVVVVISYADLSEAANPPENLFDFFQASPLAGVELDLERAKGTFREVEI